MMKMRPKTYSMRSLVLALTFLACFVGLLSIDLSNRQIEAGTNDIHTEMTSFADVKQEHQEDEEEEDKSAVAEDHSHHNHDPGQSEFALSDEEKFSNPLQQGIEVFKTRTFGVRHGHRLAHVKARERRAGKTPQKKFVNPVIEAAEDDLIPFNPAFVREAFKSSPRIEMEAEYFRFEDQFGLIDTGWTDDQVLFALQRLVDIYAQANIRIRLRRDEALARVRLSRERSLAYWFYVDYPKGEALSPERRERKELMSKVIGPDLVKLFETIDRERQGLFDFIAGWPEERTPWENENVVGMFPSFYYFFMNGGGEGGCMRFRTGDCNTPKKLAGMDGLSVMCYRLDVIKKERQVERPIVRSWERYNFTADMAIRLVAHEMGHAMTLRHPNKGCVQVPEWPLGNLMSQVMTMAPPGRGCRVTGFPAQAATATFLTDEQITMAREAVKKDLRETSTLGKRVGKTVEVMPAPCRFRKSILGFVASSVPIPEDGLLTRVRWKSGKSFSNAHRLKISVGRFDQKAWSEEVFEIVQPHSMGSFVHQEHDVSLAVEKGQLVAIMLVDNDKGEEGLMPEVHYYEDPDALAVDVVGDVQMSKRDHPTVNQIISAIDKNTIYPKVVARAKRVDNAMILSADEGWTTPASCAEWILNYDLQITV